jgi:uncharacterized delta-60 repeat protein
VNISGGAPNPNPNPNPQPQCTNGAYTFTGTSPTIDASWGTNGWQVVDPSLNLFDTRRAHKTSDGGIVLISGVSGSSNLAVRVSKFDATGAVVSAFGTNGAVTIEDATNDMSVVGTSVDSNGNIYVLGNEYNQGNPVRNVVRLSSTGTVDTNFGTNGVLNLGSLPGSGTGAYNPIFAGPSGTFFVMSATYAQTTSTYITKFDGTGVVSAFGTNGTLDVSAINGRSVLPLADGSILVGSGAQGQLKISKYTSAGALDSSWATSGSSSFGNPNISENFVNMTLDGTSVVVTYNSYGTPQGNGPPPIRIGVARVGLDGVVDTTFGIDGGVMTPVLTDFAYPVSTSVLSDGSIVIVAFQDTQFLDSTMALLRFSSTGDLDTAFASGLSTITAGTCAVETVGVVDLGSGDVLVVAAESGNMQSPTEALMAKFAFSAVVPGVNGGGFTGGGSSPSPNNNVVAPVTPPTTTPPADDDEPAPRVPGRPNLVNDDNQPSLVRPPGQSGLVVDGETQEVVTTRVETPGANVQPNRRTPAQIREIRQAANALVQNFQQQLPQGTNVPFEVVETPTGAVIRNLVFDAAGNPVDVPAEDVVLMEAQEMVLLVGANRANVTPDGRFQVPVGSSFGLAGSGFGEEEDGEFVVMSTPTLITEFATAADGTFEKAGTLPESIGVGDHTLVVATGSTYAVLGIQVIPTTLPVTGSSNDRVVIVALFTLVFGALLLRSRRTILV